MKDKQKGELNKKKQAERRIANAVNVLTDSGARSFFYLPGTKCVRFEDESVFSDMLKVLDWPGKSFIGNVKNVVVFDREFWMKMLHFDGAWVWNQYHREDDWIASEYGHKYMVSSNYPSLVLHCFWKRDERDSFDCRYIISINVPVSEFAALNNIPLVYQGKMAEFESATRLGRPNSVLLSIERNVPWLFFSKLFVKTFPGVVMWGEDSEELPAVKNSAFAFHIGRCLVQELVGAQILEKRIYTDEDDIRVEIRVRKARAAYPGVYHCWSCWKKAERLLAVAEFLTFDTVLYENN